MDGEEKSCVGDGDGDGDGDGEREGVVEVEVGVCSVLYLHSDWLASELGIYGCLLIR